MKNKARSYDECHKVSDGQIYKLCSDCNKWMPMTEENFYKNKSSKQDGFNPYCKECTKNKSAKWISNNPEKFKRTIKKYRDKPEVKENYRKIGEQLRKDGNQLKWQRNNKELLKEYNQIRKDNKKHKISKLEWEECKNYFNYRCAYCGLAIEEHYVQYKGEVFLGDFHRDHVDDNGSNDLSNCVPSCKNCNSSKHTYELNEWYNENNRIYSDERLLKINKWLNEDYKKYIKHQKGGI